MPDSPGLVRRLLASLGALSFGLFLAIILLEILLHIYNPFFARVKGNRIVLQTNKTIHFQNKIISGLDQDIVVTRNSIGFRGPNPPADFANALTLFTIGGSTTQCFMVSDEKTWTALTTAALNPSFRNLWVNNAGLDGHTTFGHRVLLSDQILPRHPKAVLFLVGANDVAVSAPNDYDSENLRGEGLNFSNPKAFMKSLSTYSEITALGLNFYRSFTAYQAGLLHSNIDITTLGLQTLSEDEQKLRVASSARPELLESYRRRLLDLVDTSKRGGAQPIFITQPTLWGSGIDDVTGVDLAHVKLAVGNGETSWRILEQYNDVTRAVCAAEKVPCIDLARLLPKSRRNFYDNAHFTTEGNRNVAAIVSTSLCPLLKERFQDYSTGPCPDPKPFR